MYEGVSTGTPESGDAGSFSCGTSAVANLPFAIEAYALSVKRMGPKPQPGYLRLLKQELKSFTSFKTHLVDLGLDMDVIDRIVERGSIGKDAEALDEFINNANELRQSHIDKVKGLLND